MMGAGVATRRPFPLVRAFVGRALPDRAALDPQTRSRHAGVQFVAVEADQALLGKGV